MTPNFEHLEKLQALTKEYSQFSKQSSGVAYMAILPLLIFAYWIGEQLPINWWGSFFGVVLSGVFITTWLFIRWRLILQFYQGFGLARAAKPEFQKGHLAGAFWGVGISLSTILILRFISGLIQFPNTLAFTTPIVIFTLIIADIIII